jgi:hypothetical protein
MVEFGNARRHFVSQTSVIACVVDAIYQIDLYLYYAYFQKQESDVDYLGVGT